MEENIVPTPVVAPSPKIPFWFWVLFLIFGILTGLIGYVIGKKSQVVLTPPIGSFGSPSPNSSMGTEYSFEQEKLLDKPWPQELRNLKKSSLRDLKCDSFGLGEGDTYYSIDEKHSQLNDSSVLDFINNTKGVINITKCSTSGENFIIEYETWAGGGGVGNIAHFGFLKPGFILAPDIQIKASDGNGPYFGCPRPIALTQDLILYYFCHGGDGGYGQEAIYKIDLKNETSKLVGRCESKMEDESSDPTISCNF